MRHGATKKISQKKAIQEHNQIGNALSEIKRKVSDWNRDMAGIQGAAHKRFVDFASGYCQGI